MEPTWRDFANYGLPTLLLVGLTLGLWRMILWAKQVVVEPIVASHLKLVQTLTEEAPKQTAKLNEIQSSLEDIKKDSAQLPSQTESLLEIKAATKSGIVAVAKRLEEHTEWAKSNLAETRKEISTACKAEGGK